MNIANAGQTCVILVTPIQRMVLSCCYFEMVSHSYEVPKKTRNYFTSTNMVIAFLEKSVYVKVGKKKGGEEEDFTCLC